MVYITCIKYTVEKHSQLLSHLKQAEAVKNNCFSLLNSSCLLGKDGNFCGIKSTFLETAYNRMPYRKEVVRTSGLPEDRQHRVETAARSGTESVQGKQFRNRS